MFCNQTFLNQVKLHIYDNLTGNNVGFSPLFPCRTFAISTHSLLVMVLDLLSAQADNGNKDFPFFLLLFESAFGERKIVCLSRVLRLQ